MQFKYAIAMHHKPTCEGMNMTSVRERSGHLSPIAEQLGQVRMTETERKHALEYLQRGERVAEFILARVRDGRQLRAKVWRGSAVLVRGLKALIARTRHDRATPHRQRRTRTPRAGTT
jgi:hypothetical protein